MIVRTAKTEGGDPSLAEAGLSITPQGSLTGSSKVSRSQVGFTSPLSHAFVVLCELVLMRLDRCIRAHVAAACRHLQNEVSVVADMPVQPHPCCRALLIMPDQFSSKQPGSLQYVQFPHCFCTMAFLLLLESQLSLHKAAGNDILTVVGVTAQLVQGSRQ